MMKKIALLIVLVWLAEITPAYTTNIGSKQSLLEQIKGNWFRDDSSNKWEYGIYDSLVIANNRLYTYSQIRSKRKQIELTVREKHGTETLTLLFSKPDKGKCQIQAGKGKRAKFTQYSVPAKAVDAEPDFEDFFRKDTAYLQGYLDGYTPNMGFETGIVYIRNVFTDEYTPSVIAIEPDGSFYGELPLEHPVENYLSINDFWIPFYIEPGQTLTMYIDRGAWKKEEKPAEGKLRVEYMGGSASIAYLMSHFDKKVSYNFDFKNIQKVQKEFTPEQFKALVKQRSEAWEHSIDSIARIYPQATKAIHLLKNKTALQEGRMMLEFLHYRIGAAFTDTTNTALKAKADESCYYFLRKMPIDDECALVEYQIGKITQLISDMDILNGIGNASNIKLPDTVQYTFPTVTFPDFLIKKGIKLNDKEEALRKKLQKTAGTTVTMTKKDRTYDLQQLTEEEIATQQQLMDNNISIYVDYISKYFESSFDKKLMQQTKFNYRIGALHYKDSLLNTYTGSHSPLLWQLAKVKQSDIEFKLFESRTLAQQYADELKGTLTHPLVINVMEQALEKAYPANQPGTYQLPEGKATEVFRRLIKPYQGKVLFIDFWATWCGPCRAGIKETAKLRKQYKNHPEFQFIYVTSQGESPEKEYREFAEKQLKDGVSLYVTASEYHYLRQLFHFNGIPHYVLVEKDGSISEAGIDAYNIGEYLKKRFGSTH